MANTVAALNPEKWKSDIQDFLNSMLVVKSISSFMTRELLVSGDTINFPLITDQRVQAYTQGTDLTVDDFVASQSQLSIDQSRVSAVAIDPTQIRQAEDKNFPVKLARQAAFVLSQEMDQNVMKNAVDTANNTVVGGTLSASTIYETLTTTMATLQRANAADGPMFAVLDPDRVALLARSEVANGFNLADSALKNGFVGSSQAGFKIFNSNNLPTSSILTMDTIPTATDTMTIAGVAWTWVADNTAAAAGEIAIGTNVAEAKVNFLLAINGTGTPGTGTYIDVTTANRRIYQNRQISAAAFVGDDSTVTGFGRQNNSETFTAGTNIFATETGSLLAGRLGALSVAMQTQPNLLIRPEPKQLADNYLTHTLYGHTVFSRDQERVVNLTINL